MISAAAFAHTIWKRQNNFNPPTAVIPIHNIMSQCNRQHWTVAGKKKKNRVDSICLARIPESLGQFILSPYTMNLNSVMRMLPLRGSWWHCFSHFIYSYLFQKLQICCDSLFSLQALFEAFIFHFMFISQLFTSISPLSRTLPAWFWHVDAEEWVCRLGIPPPLLLESWVPYILKEPTLQSSLHHILHNVNLLLCVWISSTSEISKGIFSSVSFSVAASSFGIPWA